MLSLSHRNLGSGPRKSSDFDTEILRREHTMTFCYFFKFCILTPVFCKPDQHGPLLSIIDSECHCDSYSFVYLV